MKIGKYKPSQIRKAIIAGAGAGIVLANSVAAEFAPFLPPAWSAGINVAISFVTAGSVFLTKNAPLIDAADEL